MFTGLTASEYAERNKDRPDEEAPVLTPDAGCDHYECEQKATHVMAEHVEPIYGVGCKIESWAKLCRDHNLSDMEDIFYCEGCEHDHLTNTSWELHYGTTRDGEQLCLKCYAEAAVESEGFWISSSNEVTEEWVRSRPHAIPALVEDKIAGTEWGESLDSMSGGPLYDESAGAGDRGVTSIRAEVSKALAKHDRVGVVISRVYQFAVYLEVVAESTEALLERRA
jgi:hypothetical protein